MTIDGTRDPRGRLPVASSNGPACGDRHWLGYTCQAVPGHRGRCRHYQDGSRYEWQPPGDNPRATVVVVHEP